MVSLEGLTKVVDPSQLTADFDGSLDYNHEEWIEVRATRSLFCSSNDCLEIYLENVKSHEDAEILHYLKRKQSATKWIKYVFKLRVAGCVMFAVMQS